MRTDAGSQGALQDDCSGRIVRIAVQIEDYLFDAKHADKKAAYELLLKSFTADIALSILVDDGAMATTVQAWLDRLQSRMQGRARRRSWKKSKRHRRMDYVTPFYAQQKTA